MDDPDVVAEFAVIMAERKTKSSSAKKTSASLEVGKIIYRPGSGEARTTTTTIKQEPVDDDSTAAQQQQQQQQTQDVQYTTTTGQDDGNDSDVTIDADAETRDVVTVKEETGLQTLTAEQQIIPETDIFPAPVPTKDEMTLASLVIQTAHYMLEKTPIGKSVTAAREKTRKSSTLADELRHLPMYLKWEYVEKHHQTVSVLATAQSPAIPLKLQQASHKLQTPTMTRLKPADAAIQISPEVWACIDSRLAKIKRHLMSQVVSDYQHLDTYTDGINAGAYSAEGSELPILAGELTDGAVSWTRANLAAEHMSRLTVKDTAVLEQYLRLLVNVINAQNHVMAEIYKLWRVNSDEARDACERLLDSCRVVEVDARQAACESLVHLIVARCHRSLKNPLNINKSSVASILTAAIGDSISLF